MKNKTSSTAPRTIAKNTQVMASLATLEARSIPNRLQVNVTVGCTTRLHDIACPLNISAVRVGQALDALHLRDRGLPTPEATRRGLGHRWYSGCRFLVDWHISGVTEVVTGYYDSIGWPSKSGPKASIPSCRSRRGAGR
jgi:hypothetical protein